MWPTWSIPPQFRDAFVSARTRNTTTPGLDSEKVLGVDLSYNLNLPWITARVSGYYTSVADQSKVISYYDDTQSSFTNFAMSGIDKRYYGLEVGVVVPIWGGISFNGALSLGDYRYTSDANFTQTRATTARRCSAATRCSGTTSTSKARPRRRSTSA